MKRIKKTMPLRLWKINFSEWKTCVKETDKNRRTFEKRKKWSETARWFKAIFDCDWKAWCLFFQIHRQIEWTYLLELASIQVHEQKCTLFNAVIFTRANISSFYLIGFRWMCLHLQSEWNGTFDGAFFSLGTRFCKTQNYCRT